MAAPVSFGTERVREGHAEQNKNQRTRVYTHFRASNRSCICLFFVRKADFVADLPAIGQILPELRKLVTDRYQMQNKNHGSIIENDGGVRHTWLVSQV